MIWQRWLIILLILVILITFCYKMFRKKELPSTALIRALAAGGGSWLVFHASELGKALVSGSFGDFLGRFVLYPVGWIALIEALPEEPNTPILKLLFKCSFLAWQIVVGLQEAYTGGSEKTAMTALGIGVALAIFELVESIPSFLKESIDLRRQKRENELQNNRK